MWMGKKSRWAKRPATALRLSEATGPDARSMARSASNAEESSPHPTTSSETLHGPTGYPMMKPRLRTLTLAFVHDHRDRPA
jgi:hypothetical protein